MSNQQRIKLALATGKYIVTTAGEILSSARSKTPRQLKPFFDSCGYHQVELRLDGKTVATKVHRVVWIAHRGEIPAGLEINHIDANKTNNSLDNLELVTRLENMQHAHGLGLCPPEKGIDRYNAKLNDEAVKEMRDLFAAGKSLNFVAQKYGVAKKTALLVKQRRSWKHVP